MQPQDLVVGYPQAVALGGSEDFRQRRHITAGKNIFANERPRGAGYRRAADAVDQGVTVVLQQVAHGPEIFVEMADPDMLHHPDGNDAVEFAAQVAVVEFAEFN